MGFRKFFDQPFRTRLRRRLSYLGGVPKLTGPKAYGSIVTDGSFRILSLDEGFRRLYGVSSRFEPKNLAEVIEDRVERGWYGLAELFGKIRPSCTRLREIQSSRAMTTVHISPDGSVIFASHLTSHDGSEIRLSYSESGFRIPSNPDATSGFDRLDLLISLSEIDSRFFANQFGGVTAATIRGFRFVADAEGRIAIVNPPRYWNGIGGAGSASQLGINLERMAWNLKRSGRFGSVCEAPGLGRCHVVAHKREFYVDGPYFIAGALEPIDELLAPRRIREIYPSLSPQEAAVVATLSKGLTIKQAAAALGKSNVTVALQARAAVAKLSVPSLQMLVSEVAIVCSSS